MGILTDEMKRVVTEIQLCYAVTVTPDGEPNLSPKGSIAVMIENELGFASLASPGTIENPRLNPVIGLNVVEPFTRRGFRFKGAAKVGKDPEAHGRIARILGPDYPFEQVVKIHIETGSEVFSPVYTLTQTTSEAEVKRFWLEGYGYRSTREAGGAHDCP
jgi:predicted pyridoxine 5'-phosphate oxidase superfamily flavin-nucleotide-binding protein